MSEQMCRQARRQLADARDDYATAWQQCDAGAGDDDACSAALEIALEVEKLERWIAENCGRKSAARVA